MHGFPDTDYQGKGHLVRHEEFWLAVVLGLVLVLTVLLGRSQLRQLVVVTVSFLTGYLVAENLSLQLMQLVGRVLIQLGQLGLERVFAQLMQLVVVKR